jgi:hypothetical protein
MPHMEVAIRGDMHTGSQGRPEDNNLDNLPSVAGSATYVPFRMCI